MAHPIVRTDLMSGTVDGSQLRSVMFYSDDKPAEIENGSVAKLGEMIDRETYKAEAPAKGDGIENLVLIASPELMYDERKQNLDEFTNEAGERARGYRFHKGDIASVTADGFAIAEGVTVAKGYVVELAAAGDTKLAIVATATSGCTKIGEIVDIETVDSKTYYAFEVK